MREWQPARRIDSRAKVGLRGWPLRARRTSRQIESSPGAIDKGKNFDLKMLLKKRKEARELARRSNSQSSLNAESNRFMNGGLLYERPAMGRFDILVL